MKAGQTALGALLTLSGQNTFDLEALVDLLISKEIITAEELDRVTQAQYGDKHPGVTPAEWARRHIDQEDAEALDAFFVEGMNREPPRGGWSGGKVREVHGSPVTVTHGPKPASPPPQSERVSMGGDEVIIPPPSRR